MVKGFRSQNELQMERDFLTKGYVVADVSCQDSYAKIQNLIATQASGYLGIKIEDPVEFFNDTHKFVGVENLNDFRLHVIRSMVDTDWFRPAYYKLAQEALHALVGNELAMQLRVNLSIQMPNDDSSLLPVHADVWSGDSPFEVVVWIPLVDCYQTKTMFLLPPEKNARLMENFANIAGSSSEELYKHIENEVDWIQIKAGQVLVFDQNLPHGNRVNRVQETRWSMTCRFKGVYTPYGDKKIGEFFEPITLKVASRNGMAYRFPRLDD